MTALEKDRERRYASVADLAADVARVAAQLPVSVGPPRIGYRLRKFARRHRAAVVAAVVVLVVMIGGLGLAGWGVVQIVAAHAEAVAQRVEAEHQEYTAQIAVAKAAMDANLAGPMREALWSAPPHLRHWEWRYLAARCDQSIGVLLDVPGSLRGLALVDAGAAAVVCQPDAERIEVVDTQTGANRLTLPAHAEVVCEAAAPDGLSFAICYVDGEVDIHDSDTGRRLQRLEGGDATHTHAAFSPRDGTIAVATDRGRLRFFDTDTGRQLGNDVLRPGHAVQDICHTADGRLLVTCGQAGDILVWAAASP